MEPTYQNDPLWQKLHSFIIHKAGAELAFVDRLAADNGWSRDHAQQVEREYLRFLFLSQRVSHAVTPSDAVDQAWHLHLCYTRSYWEELCGKILDRPLHHGPTKGGKSEADSYRSQYQKTLASYVETFGEKPPKEIWPPEVQRFGADFVRLDRNNVFVIERKSIARLLWGVSAFLGVAGAIQLMNFQNMGVVTLFAAFVVLLVGALINAKRTEKRQDKHIRPRSSRPGATGCGGGAGCGSSSGAWSFFSGGDGDSGGSSGCGSGCGGCGGD